MDFIFQFWELELNFDPPTSLHVNSKKTFVYIIMWNSMYLIYLIHYKFKKNVRLYLMSAECCIKLALACVPSQDSVFVKMFWFCKIINSVAFCCFHLSWPRLYTQVGKTRLDLGFSCKTIRSFPLPFLLTLECILEQTFRGTRWEWKEQFTCCYFVSCLVFNVKHCVL